MIRTFKVLSMLLCYPDPDMRRHTADMKAVLAGEGILDTAACPAVEALIDTLAGGDLLDHQESYVTAFDRTRSLSLHVFEHIHGEGRDRGQAMVDLKALYEQHGLIMDDRELPDYLPLFLEFLATRPLAEARALLAEIQPILVALGDRLMKRESPYASVFIALSALAGSTAMSEKVESRLPDAPEDPNDLDALDRAWEESVVTFGDAQAGGIAPAGGCPAARTALARMTPPPIPDDGIAS